MFPLFLPLLPLFSFFFLYTFFFLSLFCFFFLLVFFLFLLSFILLTFLCMYPFLHWYIQSFIQLVFPYLNHSSFILSFSPLKLMRFRRWAPLFPTAPNWVPRPWPYMKCVGVCEGAAGLLLLLGPRKYRRYSCTGKLVLI